MEQARSIEPEVAEVHGDGVFRSLLERPLSYKSLTSDEQRWLKAGPCKGLSDDEIEIFVRVCNRTGLDPFAKQIHAMKRKTKDGDRWIERLSIQTGIDGYRLVAQRTGEYEGQTKAEWCDLDGVWKDVWLLEKPPAAARVGIYRHGFREPVYGIALYREYVQLKFDGKTPNAMWERMPSGQLAKCAEALALRKGFPQEMQGVLTNEEMGQADNPVEVAAPARRKSPSMEDRKQAMRERLAAAVAPADPEVPAEITVEPPQGYAPQVSGFPATMEPGDSAPPYEDGTVRTIKEKQGNKTVFWIVELAESGNEFMTFDKAIQEAASENFRIKGRVRIVYETTIKGNKKIVELVPAPAPAEVGGDLEGIL